MAGQGAPLLLVHGVGSSADSWVRCIDRLAEKRMVVAPDLVGHGFTDGVDFAGAAPQVVQLRHLWGVAAALGLTTLDIAGASFGALLGALMYFERPGLVGKLVLIGSGSVFNPAHDQVKVLQAVLANQLPAAEDPTPERIRARNAGSTFERRDTFDEIVFAQLTAYALPDRARALRQTVEGLVATVDSTEHRVLHRLEDIAVPTLVVSGREDPRADWRHVESGCRRIPRATLRIVERCGHKPYAEQPAAFADALLEFLDR